MKLTKERLKALISQEITNSLGFYGGELSSQRKNALKFYLGERTWQRSRRSIAS